jgi:hypothetical protein
MVDEDFRTMIWIVMEELSWIEKKIGFPYWKTLKSFTTKKNKGCVTLWTCQFTWKKYLKAKDELWELKYFTIAKT